MNTKKTKSLTLTTKKKEVAELTLLGVCLDGSLSWSGHVDKLQRQLAASIYAIRRMRCIAGARTARMVYFSNFHSRLTYGILLWGESPAAHRVFLQQKEAIRSIVGASQRTSCREIFVSLGILTLPSCFILSALQYIHSRPNYTRHSALHTHDTRKKNDLIIPYHRVEKARTAINFHGIKFYNVLPEAVRRLDAKRFTKIINKFLLSKSFYSIQEFLELDPIMIEDMRA